MVAITLQFVLVSIALATTSALAAPSAANDKGGQTYQAPSIIPAAWKSVGDAPEPEPLTYTMSLKGQDMDGLTEKMYEISDSQGEWLTKDELKQYASVSDEGRTAITNYLKAQGLKDSDFTFSDLGDEVEVRSSVDQASKMLSAKFELFSYEGKDKVPRTKEYTVDASIADFVQNIYPIADLHEFKVPKLQIQSLDAEDVQDAANAPAGCNLELVTPQCLRNIYGTSEYKASKGDLKQVDIAIMEYLGQYTSQSDLTQFLKQYRPDAADYQIPVVSTMGAVNLPNQPGAEAMLDVCTVVAATYPLTSTVYNLGEKDLDADLFSLTFQQFLKAESQPKVVTVSYGALETDATQAQAQEMCDNAQKLTALGTTIVFASGDLGVTSIDRQAKCPPFSTIYPGGCPFITSVGGTQRFSPEEATSPDLAGYYTSAGLSIHFKTPKFQKSALSGYLSSPANQAPKGAYNTTGRGYPDASTLGFRYAAVLEGAPIRAGGTSASAPTFASIIALINDARKKKGKGSVGWINPRIYQNPQAFNDITSGGALGCGVNNTGFNATTSFDLATGLGTPKFAALRTALGA